MKKLFISALSGSALLFLGCSNTAPKPQNIMDNVEQHVVSGLKKLENNEISQARTF